VKVECDIAVFVTERSIYQGSFNEVVGVPQENLNLTWWFTWYDSQGMLTWVMIANPSASQTAHCTVRVAGVLKSSPSIGPGGTSPESYDSLLAGPVKVECDIPVVATERSIFQGSFNEVVGTQP
jgi:hypothetical protein